MKLTKNDLINHLTNLTNLTNLDLNLNALLDKMNEGDLVSLAERREEEARAYMAEFGKLDHPVVMALWYMVESQSDFGLTSEDIALFEETIFSISQEDFGNYKFEVSEGASARLKFAVKCLKSVGAKSRSMMRLQQDAFNYFYKHSPMFAQLSDMDFTEGH